MNQKNIMVSYKKHTCSMTSNPQDIIENHPATPMQKVPKGSQKAQSRAAAYRHLFKDLMPIFMS